MLISILDILFGPYLVVVLFVGQRHTGFDRYIYIDT